MKASLLYLLNDFSNASNNRRALNLIRKLDADRYEFHVNSVKQHHGPMESKFQNAGAKVVFFDYPERRTKIVSQLVQYVREHNIHILHTHNLRADLIGAIVAIISRQVILLSTKCNMSYVPGQRNWLFKNILYWPVMYIPDQLITVSDSLRHQIISRLRIHPDRVSTIYTGIPLETYFQPDTRIETRKQFGFSSHDVIITYVGRLVESKDLVSLIHAASLILAQQREIHLLIVGDGPLLPNLKAYTKELGIQPNIIYTEFRSDIPEILAATDIFVLPSIREGLPQSLIEALAARKAVITTHVGGIVEIIEPNVSGLIVQSRDPAALAEALCSLIDNPDLREELGENGRSIVNQKFNLETMVNDYDKLYRKFLNKSSIQNLNSPTSESRESIQ